MSSQNTPSLRREEAPPPLLSLNRVVWEVPSQSRVTIVSSEVSNGFALIGSSGGSIFRKSTSLRDCDEFKVQDPVNEKIYKVFLDPSSHHGIVSLVGGGAYYLQSKRAPKMLALTKLKGIVLESVAWDPVVDDKATKRILVGTTKGVILELLVEDYKEKACKKLYDIGEGASEPVPVTGLRVELFPTETAKFFVMAASPARLYQFIGGPTFEALFTKYQSIPSSYRELPGEAELGYSEVHFYSRYHSQSLGSPSEVWSWLTFPGVYHGSLLFGSQDQPGDRVTDEGKLYSYPDDKFNFKADEDEDAKRWGTAAAGPPRVGSLLPGQLRMLAPRNAPISIAHTRFHFLLLSKARLVAVNQLGQAVIDEHVFQPEQLGLVRGLVSDAREEKIFLFSDRMVIEVAIEKEDRDMWLFYLEDENFDKALEHCKHDWQRDRVHTAQADRLFKQQSYEAAATVYAQTSRSFEEITLKFVQRSADSV
jgi:hypothetical protein